MKLSFNFTLAAFWALVVLPIALFSAEFPLQEVNNGFAKSDGDPKTIAISVLSADAADELFREFVTHNEILFDVTNGRCSDRATDMAQIAESKRIILGNIFAEGILRLKSGVLKKGWMYHVAPVAFVTQSTGEPRLLVFDPALFQKAVTVEEWRSVMTDDSGKELTESRTYIGSRFQYFSRLFEQSKQSWDTE